MKTTNCNLFISIAFLLIIFPLHAQEIEKAFFQSDFSKVLSLSPSNEMDYVYLGMTYDLNGDHQQSIQILEQGLKKFPASKTISLKLASFYANYGMFSRAIKLYTPLYEQNKNDQQLLFALTDTYIQMERNHAAIELFKEALSNGMESSALYERMAIAYKGTDNNELVLWAYNQALHLDPDNMAIALQVIKYNYALKAYETTIEEADNVLRKDSTLLTSYKYKGLSLSHLNKYRLASRYLHYYLQHGNRQDVILFRTAYCHFALGEYFYVPSLLKEYYQNQEPNPETDYMLGMSLRETGDTLGAIPYFSRAIDGIIPTPKKLGIFYFELANTYRMNKNFEQAIKNYELGFEADSAGQKQCLFFKASVLANDLNQKESGLRAFEEFLAQVEEEESVKKGTYTINLADVARRKVTRLKEEIFFEQGAK